MVTVRKSDPTKVLIAGLGSIGRRHLGNLKQIEPDIEVIIWRQHFHSSPHETIPSVSRIVYTLQEAVDASPDLALITGPSSTHIDTALEFARRGIHLFIEKPLSNELTGVSELLTECHERNLILMVGYNLRFSRSLRAMRQALHDGKIGRELCLRAEAGQYLPDWRPGTDYRQGVSAQHTLGGGVVLELSHELDYARWLMGEVETVSAQMLRLSELEIDVEDTAEITLRFASGAIGNVHLNMIQRSPSRWCRIIGSNGMLAWNGITQQVELFAGGEWSDLVPEQAADRNAMYIAELRHFLDCVRNGCKPVPSGEDGLRVLEIALAAKRSSEIGCIITL